MLALIKNEFIKLFKRPKTIVLLILFFLAAAGLTFISYMGFKSAEKWESPEFRIEQANEQIKFANEWIANDEKRLKETTDKDEIEGLKGSIESEKENIKIFKEEIKHWEKEKINPTPWQTGIKDNIVSTKEQISVVKKDLKEIQENKLISKKDKEQQVRQFEERLAWMEESLTLDQDSLDKNIKRSNGSNFDPGTLMMNFSMILSLAIPLFIALFGSDIVADEATNETFKFLLIQPVSRGKILIAKFITLITVLLVLIMTTQAVIYIGAGIMNGFDGLDLLVKVGREYQYDLTSLQEFGEKYAMEVAGSGYFITIKELMVQVLLMQTLFIVAGTALVFLVSTVCKSSMIAMAISTVILGGGSIVPMFSQKLGGIAHFTFLGYNNSAFVVQGEIGGMYNNISYKPELGIILMIVSTIAFLIFANINFNRKDILV
ncbi:MAG: ABC transporter permease subunit [Clostridium sp.]